MRVLDDHQCWLAVLADSDSVRGIAQALRMHAPQEVPYPSGRPWLMGRWTSDQLVSAEIGTVKVVVIGYSAVTATELYAATERVRTTGDVDRLAAGLSGSFHLVAAVGEQVRVQGSVSGFRRVFHTRIAGVTVASDRADVLARLAGAGVDERQLAIWLLSPFAPYPLAEASGWHGVHTIPGGSYLLFDADGSERVVAWWQPPDPAVPLVEAAPALRDALLTAVNARTCAGGTMSCDLSGGLDSTTLSFLASHSSSRVVAITHVGADPGNEDAAWATQAAEMLSVEHMLFDPEQLPFQFANVRNAGRGQDNPLVRVRTATQDAYLSELLVRRGSRLHLVGHGGDEVLEAPPAYLHTTWRAHPRIAADHLQGWRARDRWPLAAALRALADRSGYQAWLTAAADHLSAPAPPPRMPQMGWVYALRTALWATPDAVDAATTLLRQAARTAEPLAPSRGQHAAIQAIRTGAHLARHIGQAMGRDGLALEAPYFDDRVIEICLSVRLHERTTPWQYKPLLVEAMRGVVPAEVLARTTKGMFGADVHAGLARHRGDLTALCDDLVLARLGLVDADALRTACLGPHPPDMPLGALETTLGAEAWLRAHPSSASNSVAIIKAPS
jgi:asparagine synthase (glutamine-hydrolysing)